MCKYSKLNLNTFARSVAAQQHRWHVGECARTYRYAAAECAKVFKLSCEYLHIYSSKSGDFCRQKISKLHD